MYSTINNKDKDIYKEYEYEDINKDEKIELKDNDISRIIGYDNEKYDIKKEDDNFYNDKSNSSTIIHPPPFKEVCNKFVILNDMMYNTFLYYINYV